MPRLTKIYTKTGDEGLTSLGSRTRVAKDSLRVQAYGAVDELNSHIGLALALGLDAQLVEGLTAVQNLLFHAGSDLCFPEEDKAQYAIPQIEAHHVEALEEAIDELTAVLGPLENFILPGGTAGAAQLHVARTVCRRAERDAVTLQREEPIGAFIIPYLNRLSDALFVMARYENYVKNKPESLWDSRV